jgi:fucose permease
MKRKKYLVTNIRGFMYLGAEISDPLYIALLLKTKNKKPKNKNKKHGIIYMLGLCVSLGRG